jgi:Xaa-Pro aminopeptidase
MKKDLDLLMQSNQIDALMIVGPAQHNSPMYYFTGGVHVSNGDLFIRPGQAPVLYSGDMEREEAAQTGFVTRTYSEFPVMEWWKQTGGDGLKVWARTRAAMLESLGLTSGRVMLYGQRDAGLAFSQFSALQNELPGLTITGDANDRVLGQVRATKDASEIEEIRKMGEITTSVVGDIAEFITSHKVKDNIMVKADGTPLTIGDVKRKIDLWLAERGAENPEATIFALGRDGGIPHSIGNPTDALCLGTPIVFDIFPCQAGGGYFYDFTRTWCLGYAPDDVQALYDNVRSVYDTIVSELKVGEQTASYQRRACELFEAMGHPTILTTPRTTDGYCHSLGHGVGLNIHEKPWFGATADAESVIVPGAVFTIEPGLYYPERGMGVRIEDTCYVTPQGEIKVFVEYPKDLVLPVG